MKKLVALALVGFLATSAGLFASPDKDALITAEKKAWQDIKDKKWDDFKKVFSADFRGVYGSGINKLDQEMTEVKTVELKSYTLGDIDAVMIDKDTALLSYSVTIEASEAGKEASGKMNAASVWKKEGNDWRLAFHTDIKAE